MVGCDEDRLLDEARAILDSPARDSKMSDDHLICECMCVSAGEIRQLLREKTFDLDLLRQEFGLGSGCSSCIKTLPDWKPKL